MYDGLRNGCSRHLEEAVLQMAPVCNVMVMASQLQVGKDAGTGYTVNIPWISKGMADADYLAAYDLILDPIISQFDPQLVLVSAGFDATDGDFLGKCYVTPAGFAALTQRLMKHAGGKLVAVLEGGYVPE